MKLNKKHIHSLIFLFVYLFAIYFWSQPYQERKLPYGEFDAISHFEVPDYMVLNDDSLLSLPHYIDIRYGNDNKFKPHSLWYPPPFHTSLGVMEKIGGQRVVPIFLMNTIMATFIIVSVYFVIYSLFGFLPAILSSLLIIFSPRDIMPYLWGQWPERFAYAFIPIILYCFYRYYLSYSDGDKNPKYLYLCALFLGINILIHPMVFFHSSMALLTLFIALTIKKKRLIFNIKHIIISAVIFMILFMLFPFQTFNIFPNLMPDRADISSDESGFQVLRLFHWSLDPQKYSGSVPASYFSFSAMHGLWTLPFLLLGLIFLAIRREDKDIFLLAWILSLYLVLHRDLIGMGTFLHRSLSATQHIFAPIMAIGAAYLFSILKLPSNISKYLKYSLILLFIYFSFSINMASASQIIGKDTYNNPLTTLSRGQYEAAEWLLYNSDPKINVTILGIPHQQNYLSATAKKIRWFAAVSQKVSRFYFLAGDEEAKIKIKEEYVLLDYTMVPDQETFDKMQEIELNSLSNHSLLYDKNDIRVYKLEP
jgi:hypothetical protein